MRTIRVTGKGQIKVHPDMTRIVITLEGKNYEYSDTLKQSSDDTEQLKDTMEPFGFNRTDLKTISFDVEPIYESYKIKDEYKRRFTGYKFTHVLKLEFHSDNTRLGKILYALANCQLHPEFRLIYTVKDTEKPKNELLGKAVQDAKIKAGVLTEAAGLKLKDIQSIDYSWGRIDFEYTPIHRDLYPEADLCCMEEKSLAMDIEPDDIEVQDTVTVLWEIC